MLNQLAPDFILRLAQERETIISLIDAERAAGSDESVRVKIESECLRKIGIPFGAIQRMPPDALLELIQRGNDLTYRSIILGELLLQDGDLSEKVGNIRRATGDRLQALCLIASSVHFLSDVERAGYQARLNALAMQLKSVSDDPYLYAEIDKYRAKAELK